MASKLATSSGAEGEATTAAPATKAWSNDKNERQALMQKRREEMILAARRKMEAKLAAEKEKAQA